MAEKSRMDSGKCTYVGYNKLVDKLLGGTFVTEKQLNDSTEQIRQYLVNGGAGHVLNHLGIGVRVDEKRFFLEELNEITRRRFVWLRDSTRRELTIPEIRVIALFLEGGPYHGATICFGQKQEV